MRNLAPSPHLSLLLALGSFALLLPSSPAQARSALLVTTSAPPATLATVGPTSVASRPVQPPSPSSDVRRGLPGRRVGGATRASLDASCNAGNHTLMALGAKNNLNLTLADRPTLMFFIPKGTEARQAELALRDSEGSLIHRQSFQLSDQDGFLMVDLGKDATMPSLKPQGTYQWSLGISCRDREIARGDRVEGWLQRLTPEAAIAQADMPAPQKLTLAATLARSLQPLTSPQDPMQRAKTYASLGLWPDALAQLCGLVTGPDTSPEARDQARQSWKGSLRQLDLPTLAQRRLTLITPLTLAVES